MYHVSPQGVDERMINVLYYYYYLRTMRSSGPTSWTSKRRRGPFLSRQGGSRHVMSTVVLVTLYTLTSVTVLLGTTVNTTQLLHTEGVGHICYTVKVCSWEPLQTQRSCYTLKVLDTSVTQ